jgi:predicted AAA+ superfamily ATPase
MIERALIKSIREKMFSDKAILILGARQTGKTTLIREIQKLYREPAIYLNCDEPVVHARFSEVNTTGWKQIIGNKRIIFIDEAQRIKNIGVKLKLVIDNIENVQLVVTGSSSFDLANEIKEPLTGRKWEYFLFPISWGELKKYQDFFERAGQLEQRLIYGMYPEVITSPGREIEILNTLSGSMLYKDLLSFRGIRKPDLLENLLRALALQIGQEVSFNELSSLLQVDKNTVMTYVNLLEQAFIIFRLSPLSRNLRNEISTSRKIYFYDNGVRNSLIANFNPMNLRNDVGALWENFMLSERIKYNHYHNNYLNTYFWRTHNRQEIDYIEEYGGQMYAYEFKWSSLKKVRFPDSFLKSYPVREKRVINPDNMEEFI